jgi:N-acetylglucosaminyldiphosphoundecaprenol N-acetyl-beta-D-mannosaminyltransferase
MNPMFTSKYLFQLDQTLGTIHTAILKKQQLLITALNVNILYKINNSENFQKLFDGFDKITFDGYYSIVWAKAMGVGMAQFVEQVSADRMMKQVFEQAGKKKWKICVLGGSPETEIKFRQQVLKIYPETDIVFHHHGYFEKWENSSILQTINELAPDILLVGLSVPKEHEWCIKNRVNLNAKVIITCGGYIEQTSQTGLDYYPANWIYKLHINWIYRVIKEPSRLWRRYLKQGLWFVCWLPWQFVKVKFIRN